MDRFSVLLLLFLVLILPLFFNFVLGGVSFSTYNFFNATNMTSFNWASANITIGSWNDSIQIYIDNKSTEITSSYNQNGRTSSSDINQFYPKWETCFPINNQDKLAFIIQNQTGNYINVTQIMNNGTTEDFILTYLPYCPPGKYIGNFTVRRTDNSSDIVKVSTVIDIPISFNNTLNSTTNSGIFRGTMSIGDQYHVYYYNTSQLTQNITGLTVSLTGLTNDIDIFVFNSSRFLKGKSIEKGSANEQILDMKLPSIPDMWEIRVYGNVSSPYDGNLYFSTLNFTNISTPADQVTSLNFRNLDANATSSTNYTVKNEGNRVLTSVYDYPEIYYVQTWSSANTIKSITNFFVPSFAQKIKVMINWTDEPGKKITDWDLFLKDSSGNSIGNSTDKFLISNVTNATREEFIVFTGPFNSTNEGFWNITVQNVTNSSIPLSYYYLTTYIWMNSNWISTSFTDVSNFNISANNSYNVSVNLTIPETYILDGKYEGFIKYNSSQGWNTILPLSFNISAGTLIINNTFNNATVRLTDNIGFNRLGASVLTLNITFNNTGSYPIYYTNITSNYLLTKDSDSNINFTVDNWLSNPINPGSNGKFNISFSINTTFTSNDAGIYRGWVFFNTTNSTLNSSSYPYKTFNLTLEVNLTNLLDVRVENVTTADLDTWIGTPTNTENVTYLLNVYLMNGTMLTDSPNGNLYVENFTNAWMNETNVTSYNVYLSNINQTTLPGTPASLCYSGYCYVNATVPANISGGRYEMSIKVRYNTGVSTLEGVGKYKPLTINRNGVYLKEITSLNFGVWEVQTTYFNTTATNYGPVVANGNITISSCPYATITALKSSEGGSNCSITASNIDGSKFYNIGLAGNGTACYFAWKIVASNVSGDQDCPMQVTYSEPNLRNITGITLEIWDNSTTTTATTESSDNAGQQQTTTTTIPASNVTLKYLNITSYPSTVSITQGGNKTENVIVKNINNTVAQLVNLTVQDIDSKWVTVNPSTMIKIENNTNRTYNVTFDIPENATVKDYTGKFYAMSIYGTDTKTFTLRITPGLKMQSEIALNLSQLQTEVKELEKQLNESKKAGSNNTEAENLFNQLKQKLNEALVYEDAKDYKSAYDLIDDIENLLNQTKTAMSKGKTVQSFLGLNKWIIIAILAVVVGVVLLYLFWPTPGFGIKKGYVPEKKIFQPEKEEKTLLQDKFDKLKERWKKAQERKQ